MAGQKGKNTMTMKELLDLISEVECELFELKSNNPDRPLLKEAHEAARDALVAFAKEIKFIPAR
jgi:hypothetical protein|nr:MAG TPA: hypothetical protein [Caudoviricetes sp.]